MCTHIGIYISKLQHNNSFVSADAVRTPKLKSKRTRKCVKFLCVVFFLLRYFRRTNSENSYRRHWRISKCVFLFVRFVASCDNETYIQKQNTDASLADVAFSRDALDDWRWWCVDFAICLLYFFSSSFFDPDEAWYARWACLCVLSIQMCPISKLNGFCIYALI